MKKLLLISMTVMNCSLISCFGVQTPVINIENDPFVIGSVEMTRYPTSINCIYIRNKSNSGFNPLWASRPEVIAPCGFYNVGDTLKFMK